MTPYLWTVFAGLLGANVCFALAWLTVHCRLIEVELQLHAARNVARDLTERMRWVATPSGELDALLAKHEAALDAAGVDLSEKGGAAA